MSESKPRNALLLILVAVLLLLAATPASAHTLHGDVDAPLPFAAYLAGAAVAHWGLGWEDRASLVAGVVLSETGVAVVYALLVEEAIGNTAIGQRVLAATLATSLGTAIAIAAAADQSAVSSESNSGSLSSCRSLL